MESRVRAFTLIELLVVIAIVAVLAAILFPVFASAKVAARRTECMSNMRQLGLGIRMYADEHDGFAPLTAHTHDGEPEVCWVNSLLPYLGNVDRIRISPADPKGKERLANDGTSYVLNDWVVLGGSGTSASLDRIARPSEAIHAFTISDATGSGFTQDHTHARRWFASGQPDLIWRAVLRDIQPDRHRTGWVPPTDTGPTRLEGSANYLYLDGHVRAMPARRIRGWVDQRTDFSRPPTE